MSEFTDIYFLGMWGAWVNGYMIASIAGGFELTITPAILMLLSLVGWLTWMNTHPTFEDL